LADRLQVRADESGFPLKYLGAPVEAAAAGDWPARFAQALVDVLSHVERQLANPTGTQRWVRTVVVLLADWAPLLALLGVIILKLWQYTVQGVSPHLGDLLLPLFVVLMVLVLLHVLIAIVMPLRWPAIRADFERRLDHSIQEELNGAYLQLPDEVNRRLHDEARKIEQIAAEAGEIEAWLARREENAAVAPLYGSQA
jgi:hypothetical protein